MSGQGRCSNLDATMVGGFVIGGTEPKAVIIRAIGPGLSQFGVPDVFAGP